MRIIGAMCVYNEEDNVYHGLEEIHRIADLDCVHVLDGAWRNGGSSPNSTDRTEAEIERFKRDYPLRKVYYEKNPLETPFESESAKRNYQLYLIEAKLAPKEPRSGKIEPYYVFVFDADEEIRFADGREQAWLKGEEDEGLALSYKHRLSLNVKVYAKGETRSMLSLRFIPGRQGVHYYTGVSMVVHDKDHKVIMDYNLDVQKSEFIREYVFDEFFIVNRYERKGQRLQEKIAYLGSEEERRKSGYSEKCAWTPT